MIELSFDPFTVLKRPVASEKAVRLMDEENKLVFIVDRRANKHVIRRAVEEAFEVKVVDVRTLITPRGEKKAYVKLAEEFKARDVASRMGIL